MKRFVSLLLCLTLAVLSIVYVSADDRTEVNESNLSFEERQSNSVNANNAMMDYFLDSSEVKIRSVDFRISDYYPDYYGGSYIDENGDLVVLIADKDTQTSTEWSVVSEIADDPIVVNCEYSYSDLENIMDEILLAVEAVNESGSQYSGQVNCWAIDDKNNCIYVYLKDLNNDVIEWFKTNVSDSDAIVFKQSNNKNENTANLSGQGITAIT